MKPDPSQFVYKHNYIVDPTLPADLASSSQLHRSGLRLGPLENFILCRPLRCSWFSSRLHLVPALGENGQEHDATGDTACDGRLVVLGLLAQLVALLVRDLVAVACGHRRAPARSLVAALIGAAIARRAVSAAVVIKVSSAQVLIGTSTAATCAATFAG